MKAAPLTWLAALLLLSALACQGEDKAQGQPDLGQQDQDSGEDLALDTAPQPDLARDADPEPDLARDMAPEDAPEPDTGPQRPVTPDYLGQDAGDATEGTLSVITYNVAGLPQGISGSNPATNIPQISPLLRDYDLVLVQEDFWYHAQLVQDLDQPYQSAPWNFEPQFDDIGDGLNRFSRVPFGHFERISWGQCHGNLDCASDCLATKGFSFAVTRLSNQIEVDVYNIHAEAGRCEEDKRVRQETYQLLLAFMQERSAGRAILLAGDFNLRAEREEDLAILDELRGALGLTDACLVFDCEDRIDRVMVRSSPQVTLTPTSWDTPAAFVDAQGEDLSDHKPVAVQIHWAAP